MRRQGAFALLTLGTLLAVALSWAALIPGGLGLRAGQTPAPDSGRSTAKGAGKAARAEADTGACPYVEFKLQAPKDRYYRGEPIVVECRLVNNSKTHDILYFCVYGRYFNPHRTDMIFHVGVTQKGVAVETTRFGSQMGALVGSSRSLPPGRSDTRRVTVNTIFDTTTMGEYRISASIPVQGPDDDGQQQVWVMKSEEIKVVVAGEVPEAPLRRGKSSRGIHKSEVTKEE